ncbi:MAG: cytidine deaminase [Oscillospiraceae bacterium]|nr:cytidine deaminase [Oscillospiraceae bacterium]
MSKLIDSIRQFFAAQHEPVEEDSDLIRNAPGVRQFSHSFKTVTLPSAVEPDQPVPLDESAKALLSLAEEIRTNAHAEYSKFRVSAALLTSSGKVYLGVNIENASYPAGICAERSAVSAAITAGEREFTAIAICGGLASEPCFPCGICRQVLSEFCGPDFPVILSTGIYPLKNLLPHSFTL